MPPQESAQEWTVLAHLLRPQGRKGELLAELLTDFPDRFSSRPEVQLARPLSPGVYSAPRPATIAHHWLPTGRNHGRIVLTLAGVETINQAELLAGLDVIVPAEARVQLEAESEYISDLVGCQVYDSGVLVGTVTDVEFPMSADGMRRLDDAAPLLNVDDSEGEEILIPYVQQFLIAVAVDQRRIEMSLPEGLVDINRPGRQSAPGGEVSTEDGDAD